MSESKVKSALRALYEETADYIRINNLGDVHHNRSMKMAKDALKTGIKMKQKPESKETKAINKAFVVMTTALNAFRNECRKLKAPIRSVSYRVLDDGETCCKVTYRRVKK